MTQAITQQSEALQLAHALSGGKLENELSARGTGSLKPVAWMHEDTFYNMQNTARSEKTRWLVYNLSEHHSTSGMIPLCVMSPVQDKQGGA